MLQKHGILIGRNIYKVELMAFISDTPARAFLKCTKGQMDGMLVNVVRYQENYLE